MRNTCIVLHNHRCALDPKKTNGILNAFLSGGYYFDKLEFLSYDDAGSFKQAVAEAKNFSDIVVIICDPPYLSPVRETVEACYNTRSLTHTILDLNEKTAFLLPCGEEGERITADEALPYLDRKYRDRSARMVIRAVGVPSDLMDDSLREAKRISQGKLNYNVTSEYDDYRIEIIYDNDTPKMLIDDVTRVFAIRLVDYIYALDDTSLAERLHQAIRVRKMNISVAESFTGGGIAKRLVEVPGISGVFHEGIVSYSNDSKMDRLGVQPYTIRAYGAVSDDTAYEMALGLINTGKCDLAIATTGIAGPKSDSTNKPVGLCYIAIGLKTGIYIYKFVFKGDRKMITETAINHALFLAYKQIK